MHFSKKKPFLLAVLCLMIVVSGCSNNDKVFDEVENIFRLSKRLIFRMM